MEEHRREGLARRGPGAVHAHVPLEPAVRSRQREEQVRVFEQQVQALAAAERAGVGDESERPRRFERRRDALIVERQAREQAQQREAGAPRQQRGKRREQPALDGVAKLDPERQQPAVTPRAAS